MSKDTAIYITALLATYDSKHHFNPWRFINQWGAGDGTLLTRVEVESIYYSEYLLKD